MTKRQPKMKVLTKEYRVMISVYKGASSIESVVRQSVIVQATDEGDALHAGFTKLAGKLGYVLSRPITPEGA
jgi:hypothetical protein